MNLESLSVKGTYLETLLNEQRIRRARSNLLDFTTFTKRDYQTNWHHKVICQKLDDFISGKINRLMISCPPQNGKALKTDTPIPTPSGWTTIIQLKPGDEVFSDTGEVCKVIAVSPILFNRPVYKVTSDTGDSVIADAEHEWIVRLDRKRPKFLAKTTKYLAERTSPRNPLLRQNGALILPELDLPIDPYVLGVWLGDGRSKFSAMCSNDQEIIDEIIRIEGQINIYENRNGTIHFRPGPHYRHEGVSQSETLQARLRQLNLLGNKHIPVIYLRTSIEQRLGLLQGLIDTDGYVSKEGQIEFCSINKNLACDVKELINSLGVKASVISGKATCNGKDCGSKYRVMFYMKDAARLKRKAIRTKNGTKHPGSFLTIEPAGYADTICIQVDSHSHQFLCGKGMLPTHNSELVSRRLPAFMLGKDPNAQIIACSYAADLAQRMNRDVQRIIDSPEYSVLFPETRLSSSNIRTTAHGNYLRNSDIFEIVGHNGVYRSAGVGGGITGMGAKWLIIDDPYKNREEAESPTTRKKIYDWYTDVFYTRQGKDAGILLTMTRWHKADLTEELLDLANTNPDADQWDTLVLPALSEDVLAPYDQRTGPNQPLWPEKYTLKFLLKTKATVPTYTWLSLYQQRPVAAEGNLVKKENFKYCTLEGDLLTLEDNKKFILPHCIIFQTCDPAASEKKTGNDFVLGTWVQTPTNDLALIDILKTRLEVPKHVPLFKQQYFKFRPAKQWIETDGIGRSTFQLLKDEGMPIDELKTGGQDKLIRFIPAATRITAGGVYFLRNEDTMSTWLPGYEAELLSFPSSKQNGQVDVTSYAAQVVIEHPFVEAVSLSDLATFR
ncbi:MAG: terminase family protein [Methanosarcina sp.]|nr:terminase family protein [Methanosarcina sp.]